MYTDKTRFLDKLKWVVCEDVPVPFSLSLFLYLTNVGSMKLILTFFLMCFFVGCGGDSPEEEAPDDSMSVPAEDGGEPVLSEDGP